MLSSQKNKRKASLTGLLVLLAFGLSGLITSCKKKNASSSGTTPVPLPPGDSLIAPLGFSFQTTRTVSININLASTSNEPIAGVPVNVYTGDPLSSSPILTALTDNNGVLQAQVNVPAYLDTLTIDPHYVGLIRNAKAVISNDAVTGAIGGATGYGGSIVETASIKNRFGKMRSLDAFHPLAATSGGVTCTYPGAYGGSGVPKNLVSPPDVISAALLADLNASLPETINLNKLHPEYLQSTVHCRTVPTRQWVGTM